MDTPPNTEQPIELDINAVVEAYRAKVSTAVGTVIEPTLWDAALQTAATAAVRRQAERDLAALTRQLEDAPASDAAGIDDEVANREV